MSTRRFVCAGNWKMNTLKTKIEEILQMLRGMVVSAQTDVIIAPPSAYLQYVQMQLPSHCQLAAQNCYKTTTGAFTGEISPAMLLDIGVQWVILGHSERRHIFGETNALIAEKVSHSINEGLRVIACIGETQKEREANRTSEIVQEQLGAIAAGVADWNKVIIAYEPVWAIGTGLVATPEQAQEVHLVIRKWLENKVAKKVADSVRIVYGGSVNSVNCEELAKQPDVDGFLVGGASLTEEFAKIAIARD